MPTAEESYVSVLYRFDGAVDCDPASRVHVFSRGSLGNCQCGEVKSRNAQRAAGTWAEFQADAYYGTRRPWLTNGCYP